MSDARLVDELALRIARLERLVGYWQRTGAAPTPFSKADGAIVERDPLGAYRAVPDPAPEPETDSFPLSAIPEGVVATRTGPPPPMPTQDLSRPADPAHTGDTT